MGERTFDDFDDFAKDYRSIHTDNLRLSGADSLYFAEHKVLQLKSTELNYPLKVLDVGCGDGATEYFINQHFSQWQVNGIDISASSIEEANSRQLAHVQFNVFDGIHIPFPQASFDIVFIAAVLHHIEFALHHPLILEIHRVLKPGGRLYLVEHNPINPVTRHLVNTCVFDKDARLLPYGYSYKLLTTAGFFPINKKFILFFPRRGFLSKLIWLEPCLTWLPIGGQYFFRAVK